MKYTLLSFLNDMVDIKYEGVGKLISLIRNPKSLWRLLTLLGIILLPLFLFINIIFIPDYGIGPLACDYDNYIIEFDDNQKEKFKKNVFKLNSLRNLSITNHTVVLGENFWKISQKRDVDINSIFGFNSYLKDIYAYERQQVLVPNKKGCIHIVRKGEKLKDISDIYRIEEKKIKKVNGLGIFKKVKAGTYLFIPGAIPQMLTKEMHEYYIKTKMFISPCNGRMTGRGFGTCMHPVLRVRKFHKGLDIIDRHGAPICAASGGVVIYAGSAGGYGKLIKIDHGKIDGKNRYHTYYAHCSRIHVRSGQRVKQGQIIGKVGRTGRVTGTHLHFEVRKNNKPVNPCLYLW